MRIRRDDRGATLVEAAIVAPVMIFIVLAIVQLAFAYRSASITTTASRASARVAAATYGDAGDLVAIVDAAEIGLADLPARTEPVRMLVYEANASGLPTSGSLDACGSSCIRYDWNSDAGEFQPHSGAWADPDRCGQVLDRIGIHLRVEFHAFSPILSPTLTVDERTVMRLEPGAFGTCTAE